MAKGRTRGPNRPSGTFVRHDWMWMWLAGSNLRNEIVLEGTHGAPGGTPNAHVQIQSADRAMGSMASRATDSDDRPDTDEEDLGAYDFGAAVDMARDNLGEEVKDACSVASENLEEYRRLRGITAAQAGEALGVNESTFRTKMRAPENMRLGEFLALCATLEVDPGVALGFIDGEDAPAVRNMHRLGKIEDHRYIGELAEFLMYKTGSYLPKHAIVPHAIADYEHGMGGDKTSDDDRWPRWYETDDSYEEYGPYWHAEWDDEEGDDDSEESTMTGYFRDADGSIYDPDQERRDAEYADEVMAYFTERGIEVHRVGSNQIAISTGQPVNGDSMEETVE